MWSLDLGTQETEKEVRHIDIRGCDLRTGCDPTAPAKDHLRPKVWLETDDVQNITIGADEIAYVVGPGN